MDWFSLCQGTVIVPGNSVEFIMVIAWQKCFKYLQSIYWSILHISYSGYAQKTKTQIRAGWYDLKSKSWLIEHFTSITIN